MVGNDQILFDLETMKIYASGINSSILEKYFQYKGKWGFGVAIFFYWKSYFHHFIFLLQKLCVKVNT